MMKIRKKIMCIILLLTVFNGLQAQNNKPSVTVWDGMAIAGYVNNGGFVNFGGPTVKLIKKPWVFGFGILPTMRIKEDKVSKGATKNSMVMPTAGFGFTFVYKHFVTQVPFYYNSKTATANGKWNVGLGIGFKF
jgi:hypothetical protein